MKDILNKEKLEKILLSNWAEFIHLHTLLDFVKKSLIKHLDIPEASQVLEIRISRFEPVSQGFLLWLEATISITSSLEPIKSTVETFLSLPGEIYYVDAYIA